MVARLPVSWAGTEPIPGIYRWESLDRGVAGLTDHGVLPVFTLIAAPDWAVGSCVAHDGYTCGVGKDNTEDYVRFAERLLARYPGSLVQSWNEPNTCGSCANRPGSRRAPAVNADRGGPPRAPSDRSGRRPGACSESNGDRRVTPPGRRLARALRLRGRSSASPAYRSLRRVAALGY